MQAGGIHGWPAEVPERCTWAGVEELQRKIRARWAPYVIQFRTAIGPFDTKMRTTRVDLRSDMINGLPRGLYYERTGKGKAR